MKKIGLVGGVGWRSTVDYYSEICRLAERRHAADPRTGVPSMPEMSLESLDLRHAVALLGKELGDDDESWSGFDAYHRDALRRLAASGADFALMASNTPHHRFASIVRGVGIPVLDLFALTAAESARHGAREVLILGTALTLRSPRLRAAFARYGIAAAGPGDAAARAATLELIADLQLGRLEGSAERLRRIAGAAVTARGTSRPPVVCLACTELPQAFEDRSFQPAFEDAGLLYIDTTAVHIHAAFDRAMADQAARRSAERRA
jgi:aspartate racemase